MDELHVVSWDSHAIGLGDSADVVGSSDGTRDGGLLFVVCETFSGEIGTTALGDLKNDRGFDIPERVQFLFGPSCDNRYGIERTGRLREPRSRWRKR